MLYNWLVSQAAQVNWWVAAIFILGILPQIFFSYRDGTLFSWQHQHVDLPLSWHWGVIIGDPILAILFARIWSGLHFNITSILLLIASAAISWLLHQSWKGISGHMFKNGRLTPAGWCHLIYFVVALELIFEFIFTPMARSTVLVATNILLLFAPFAVFEPGLAEWVSKVKRKPKTTWFWRSLTSLVLMWTVILITAHAKLW
ncbi:MAG: hypothetical protein PHF50_04770 [Patescibacteria group bacterium]|nr:hypothetical protein [Patescibacteria group bacterium]